MKYTSIYKNGKVDRFFIKIDKPEEFNILQPYFLVTDCNHKGNIREMDCLFSGSVWTGKQSHGYGYSSSADVYCTLHDIIRKLYDKKIVDGGALDVELRNWNTHDDYIVFSDEALTEIAALNSEYINAKYN